MLQPLAPHTVPQGHTLELPLKSTNNADGNVASKFEFHNFYLLLLNLFFCFLSVKRLRFFRFRGSRTWSRGAL